MDHKEITIMEAGKETMVLVKVPSYEDIEEADNVYNSKVAELVRMNKRGKKMLLRVELDEFLRESGFWTEQDEIDVAKLQAELDETLKAVKKGGIKLSDGREACIRAGELRAQVFAILAKKQKFDDTTVEAVAENERTDYLIYKCTCYPETMQDYWNSFEDMKNDKVSEAYRKASGAMFEFMNGISADVDKNLPEVRWLRRFNFVDDNLNYTDRKTGKPVDRFNRPVEVLDEDLDLAEITDNFYGDIKEESPYLDDDGTEVVDEEKPKTPKRRTRRKPKSDPKPEAEPVSDE